ncbi:MAG TPA: sulfatase [Chloroflexota bacterium]|nr:sulfatase [Chloroflexota bacterium]
MNFIVILLDTLRYDFLGINGNPTIRTPNLDRFARQATCFDRAYTGSFPTIPFRKDAFTGRFGEPLHPWGPLSWETVTLPELMRNAGYVTMLIHDTPHLVNFGFGFDRPFHGWEMIRGQEIDRYRTDPIRREHVKFDPSKMRFADSYGAQTVRNTFDLTKEEDHCTFRLFQTATRWLERNRAHDRFFLWIDSFAPHEPWDPPQHYVDLYDPGYQGEVLTFPHYGSLAHLPPAEVKHFRALYCAMVTMVDRWLGHLLDQLEVLGLADNTTVVVASDHGTYAGDRLLSGKPAPYYQEIGHTVLMVRQPGQTDRRRVDSFIQPCDLMPTILDLARIPVPPSPALQGISFAPALQGAAIPRRELAVTAAAITDPKPGVGHAALTTADWAMFDSPDPAQRRLFNLREDSGQARDVIAERPGIADELHGAFLEFLAKHDAPPELLAFWRNEPGAAAALAARPEPDAYQQIYRDGQRRGLGLTPRSFIRQPEFGEGRP